MDILTQCGNFVAKTRTSHLINVCFLASFICVLALLATGKYTGAFIQYVLISLEVLLACQYLFVKTRILV
jgi:hypothetical protein